MNAGNKKTNKGDDWTRSPAAIVASIVLGLVSIGGLGWSINRSIQRDTHINSGAPTGVAQPNQSSEQSKPKQSTTGSMSVIKLIDLNTADLAQLDLLPGIGPALASRIIADRNKNGRFKTIEELDRVKGIGPKTIEKIRPLATISD